MWAGMGRGVFRHCIQNPGRIVQTKESRPCKDEGQAEKTVLEKLTNCWNYGMISTVEKSIQEVLPHAGRKGNQVKGLNDPVTVSGKRYPVRTIARG